MDVSLVLQFDSGCVNKNIHYCGNIIVFIKFERFLYLFAMQYSKHKYRYFQHDVNHKSSLDGILSAI
jgi:hypothetical protein